MAKKNEAKPGDGLGDPYFDRIDQLALEAWKVLLTRHFEFNTWQELAAEAFNAAAAFQTISNKHRAGEFQTRDDGTDEITPQQPY